MAQRQRIDDLRTPITTGNNIRPLDTFVAANQQAPRSRGVTQEFAPLAKQIVKKLIRDDQRDEADQIAQGEAFALQDSEGLATLKKTLEASVEGLTDLDEIADAQSATVNKLVEANIIPPQANPLWLIGVSRGEMNRKLQQLQVELRSRTDEFAVISDKNGDLIEDQSDAARQFLDERVSAIFLSPLARNSRVATEAANRALPGLEGEFFADISTKQMANQEVRAKANRVNELKEGREIQGEQQMGFITVAQAGLSEEGLNIVMGSLSSMKNQMRDREGAFDVNEDFMTAVASFADEHIEDNPRMVVRFLNRIGKFELIPGLPIEKDSTKSVAIIHALRARAKAALDGELRREASAQNTFNGAILLPYSLAFQAVVQAHPGLTPDQVHDQAMLRLDSDADMQKLMDAAGVFALSSQQRAGLKTEGRRLFANEQTFDAQTDTFVIGRADDMVKEGVARDQILKYVRDNASGRALAKWASTDRNQRWSEVTNLPDYPVTIGRRTAAAKIPRGLSLEQTRAIEELQVGLRTTTDSVSREADAKGAFTTFLSSPAITQATQAFDAAFDAIVAPQTELVSEFNEALNTNRLAVLDDIIKRGKGVLSVAALDGLRDAQVEAEDSANNRQKHDETFKETMRSFPTELFNIAVEQGLSKTSAIFFKDEVMRELSGKLSQIEVDLQGATVAEQKALRGPKILEAVESVRQAQFSDKQKELSSMIREQGPEKASEFQKALNQFSTYKGTGSSIVDAGGIEMNIPPVYDDPRSITPFLSFQTLSRDTLFGRTQRIAGLHSIRDILLTGAAGNEDALQRMVVNQAIGGRFSADQIVAGAKLPALIFLDVTQSEERDIAGDFFGPQRERGFFDPLRGQARFLDPEIEHTAVPTMRAAMRKLGFEVEEIRPGALANGITRYTIKRKLAKLHPTLTLPFQSARELDEWQREATVNRRRAHYKALGLPTTDMDIADRNYRSRIIRRLQDYK